MSLVIIFIPTMTIYKIDKLKQVHQKMARRMRALESMLCEAKFKEEMDLSSWENEALPPLHENGAYLVWCSA